MNKILTILLSLFDQSFSAFAKPENEAIYKQFFRRYVQKKQIHTNRQMLGNCPNGLQLCYLISKTLTFCEGTNSQCKKCDRSVLEEDYQLNF